MSHEQWENEFKEILLDRGWLCTRSAGSMGLSDLAVAPPPFHKPRETVFVEVKSAKKKRQSYIYNPSSDDKYQYMMLRSMSLEGFYPLYAVRWKNLEKDFLCELCGKTQPTYSHIKHKHDISYEEYKEKYKVSLDEEECWEIFSLDNPSKHKYRSNQTYPSYRRGEGYSIDEVFPDYSDKIDVTKVIEIKEEELNFEKAYPEKEI